MGIYIKKLKAPETCRDCFMFGTCRYGDKLLQCRADDCPIVDVEITVPHDRMIDSDAYENYIEQMLIKANIDAICTMTTIIEGEEA